MGSPAADEERDRRVYLEQVTLLYEQAVPALVMNSSLGTLITIAYWGEAPHWAMVTWAALVASACALSAAVVTLYRRAQVTIDNVNTWGRWRLVETTVTGLAWGSCALLILPHASFMYKMSLLLIVAGFAAGAVPVNAPRIEVYVAYALPLIAPLLWRLIVVEPGFRVVGITGIPFFLSMVVTAQRIAKRTESALRVQFDNWSLARELEYETAERLRAEEQLHMRSKIDQLSESLRVRNEDLTRALRRAEEAAKTKSQFLANMSHELRTPLNAIINIPEGLEVDFVDARVLHCSNCAAGFEPDPGEMIDDATACPACKKSGALRASTQLVFAGNAEHTRKYLRSIRQCGKNLLDLVTDLLDFSKIEAGKATIRPKTVAVRALMGELVAALSPLADAKRIALRAGAVDEACSLEADPVKLSQILTNIVGNAIKFSDDDSAIDIEVERTVDSLLFRVRDRGIGIAQENHELIFEAFRQVDGGHTRKYGGSGLGLAITRELVTLHGGRIWLDSAPGAGSTFHVQLPLRQPAPSGGHRSSRIATVQDSQESS